MSTRFFEHMAKIKESMVNHVFTRVLLLEHHPSPKNCNGTALLKAIKFILVFVNPQSPSLDIGFL